MKAENSGRKPVSRFRIVVVTVIITLLAGGGIAHLTGYFGPREFKTEMPQGKTSDTHKPETSKHQAHDKKKILYWRAPMNPTEIYDKPGKSAMGMDLVPVYAGDVPDQQTIRIDPVVQQNMGIRVGQVKKGPLVHTIRTYGHITPDETLTAQVNLKTSGWIEKLFVDFTGKYVQKGEPLFDLYSPELVAAQEEYLVAFRTMGQPQKGSGRSLLGSSKNRLRYFDVPESEISRLEETGKIKRTVMIRSPLSGFVIQRHAEEGGYVKAGQMVFQIADLTRVWAEAHIYEYELSMIKEGQEAQMTLPYLPGETFSGTVAFVYPYLQPKTRDLVVRLVFQNEDLLLKPDMYADIRIKTKLSGDGLMIPSEAVIRTGRRNVVFISLGDGKFLPRDVVLGPVLENDRVQVIAGLAEGELVVLSGQFLLDSESSLKEAVRKMLDAKKVKKMKQEEEDFFADME